MKLPGMQFLQDRKAAQAFEAQDASWRDLVFYSEGSADWPHLGPIVEALLRDHERPISYLTSDPSDPGLAIEDDRLRAFNIGSGTARTVLFARAAVQRFVMTLPDLGNLWLKRSARPVHYVYLFHSMNSTHTSYRRGAFDGFDTILCVGPHHVAEIRKAEEVYGLPAKNLVEHGSVKLDTLLDELARHPTQANDGDVPEVLIAPTWGESSLIEQPIGRALIEALLAGGIRTVLRPHPMTVRRLPESLTALQNAYGSSALFRVETEMSATESWLRSDLMVSDWSGAAIEYAFALLKPVIYIDTPPKIMNPSWTDLGLGSFEAQVRSVVGRVVEVSEIGGIVNVVRDALRERLAIAEKARSARERLVFNVGSSARVAANYLAGRDHV